MIWTRCLTERDLQKVLNVLDGFQCFKWMNGSEIKDFTPDNTPIWVCISNGGFVCWAKDRKGFVNGDYTCDIKRLSKVLIHGVPKSESRLDETEENTTTQTIIAPQEEDEPVLQVTEAKKYEIITLDSGVTFWTKYPYGMPAHCLTKRGITNLGKRRYRSPIPTLEAIQSNDFDLWEYASTYKQYLKLNWIVNYYKGLTDGNFDFMEVSNKDDSKVHAAMHTMRHEISTKDALIEKQIKKIELLTRENDSLKEKLKKQHKCNQIVRTINMLSVQLDEVKEMIEQ